MPKLRQSVEERANRCLEASIKSHLILERGTDQYKALVPVIGMGVCTVYERKKNPDNFRLVELRRMFNTLRFTDEQILAVFGRGGKSA